MRIRVVTILLFVLVGPALYFVWNDTTGKANAEATGESPTKAKKTTSSASVVALAKQVQQLQQTVQALQSNYRSGRTVLPELLETPEDLSLIWAGETPAEQSARLKIEAVLASPASIEFTEAPLREVIRTLKDKHDIEIRLDLDALKEAGVEPEVLVTKHVKNTTLRTALHLLLDDMQLKYVVHNGMLLITSSSKAESDEYMPTILYPVRDLVVDRDNTGKFVVSYQAIQDLITQTIGTKTWQENGGNATISPFMIRDRLFLVISQTDDMHEHVAALLTALRKAIATNGKPANEPHSPIKK